MVRRHGQRPLQEQRLQPAEPRRAQHGDGRAHHDLQLPVPLRALPARHQMKHVHALVRLAVLLALRAGELDAPRREERAPGRGVDHLDQPLCIHAFTSVSQTICSFGLVGHTHVNGMDKVRFIWACMAYRIEVLGGVFQQGLNPCPCTSHQNMSGLSFVLLKISELSLFAELATYNFTCECRNGHERGRADGENWGNL